MFFSYANLQHSRKHNCYVNKPMQSSKTVGYRIPRVLALLWPDNLCYPSLSFNSIQMNKVDMRIIIIVYFARRLTLALKNNVPKFVLSSQPSSIQPKKKKPLIFDILSCILSDRWWIDFHPTSRQPFCPLNKSFWALREFNTIFFCLEHKNGHLIKWVSKQATN